MDGISEEEARAYAEWRIFGQVDGGHLVVSDYSGPISDGKNWRFDVTVETTENQRNQPLYIDKVTGRAFGEGWSSTLVGSHSLDDAYWELRSKKEQLYLNVFSKPYENKGDPSTKEACRHEALDVAKKLQKTFPGKFAPIKEEDFKLVEETIHREFVEPLVVYRWHAIAEVEEIE